MRRLSADSSFRARSAICASAFAVGSVQRTESSGNSAAACLPATTTRARESASTAWTGFPAWKAASISALWVKNSASISPAASRAVST